MLGETNQRLPLVEDGSLVIPTATKSKALLAAFEAKGHPLGPVASEEAFVDQVFTLPLNQTAEEVARLAQFYAISERSTLRSDGLISFEPIGTMKSLLIAIGDSKRDANWRVNAGFLFVTSRIRGAEQAYLDAVLDSALSGSNSPLLLTDMEIVPRAKIRGQVEGYKHVVYDRAAIANALSKTRNEQLIDFLLDYLERPTDIQQREFAHILTTKNDYVLEKFCTYLNRWNRLVDTSLTYGPTSQSKKTWTNKAQIVGFWRKYFGV